jgi:hypothetical protein
MDIKEVIALHFSDPESQAGLAKAKAELDEKKRAMSREEYCDWFASHFVCVELPPIRKDPA